MLPGRSNSSARRRVTRIDCPSDARNVADPLAVVEPSNLNALLDALTHEHHHAAPSRLDDPLHRVFAQAYVAADQPVTDFNAKLRLE